MTEREEMETECNHGGTISYDSGENSYNIARRISWCPVCGRFTVANVMEGNRVLSFKHQYPSMVQA